jgi:hypothetical protein
MKLSKVALIEIVEIVREGLSEGKDISELLRQLDLAPIIDICPEHDTVLCLSEAYVNARRDRN